MASEEKCPGTCKRYSSQQIDTSMHQYLWEKTFSASRSAKDDDSDRVACKRFWGSLCLCGREEGEGGDQNLHHVDDTTMTLCGLQR